MNTTQIRFAKTITHPGDPDSTATVQFCTTLHQDGVEVAIGDRIIGKVAWEHLDTIDNPETMDLLATAFQQLQVWQFRVVCVMLGDAMRKGGRALVE